MADFWVYSDVYRNTQTVVHTVPLVHRVTLKEGHSTPHLLRQVVFTGKAEVEVGRLVIVLPCKPFCPEALHVTS